MRVKSLCNESPKSGSDASCSKCMKFLQAVLVALCTASPFFLGRHVNPDPFIITKGVTHRPVTQDWWLDRGPGDHVINMNHPHQGARHPNGTLGMVVNPSVDRLLKPRTPEKLIDSFESGVICPSESDTFGIEGEQGNLLLQRIRRGLHNLQAELAESTRKIRVLCMIHTESDDLSKQAAIAETWGQDCDGFFGASNLTDHSIGTIDLPYKLPGASFNIWQKVRTMWTYAYHNYLDDYDYFFIVGDSSYVLMDHLRHFLMSDQIHQLENGFMDRVSETYAKEASATAQLRPRPLLLATPMAYRNYLVAAGWGGYLLNPAALKMWGEKGADGFRPEVEDSRDDIYMSEFFMEHGVYVSDTQDEAGGWRFGGSAEASMHFEGFNSPLVPTTLKRRYGFANNVGIDHVSQHQVSFHLNDDKKRVEQMGLSVSHLMFRYHAYFKSWCGNDQEAS